MAYADTVLDTPNRSINRQHNSSSYVELTIMQQIINESCRKISNIPEWFQLSYTLAPTEDNDYNKARANELWWANAAQLAKWLIILGVAVTTGLFSFGVIPAAIAFAIYALPVIAGALYAVAASIGLVTTGHSALTQNPLVKNAYEHWAMMLFIGLALAAATVLSSGLLPLAAIVTTGAFFLALKAAPLAVQIAMTVLTAISATYAFKALCGLFTASHELKTIDAENSQQARDTSSDASDISEKPDTCFGKFAGLFRSSTANTEETTGLLTTPNAISPEEIQGIRDALKTPDKADPYSAVAPS
jgi:hypothetical protein